MGINISVGRVNLMQVVVSTVAKDQERRRAVGADGFFDSLIVVNMAGQDKIGNSSGISNSILKCVGHLRASAMKNIEGVNWVVQGEDQGTVGGGGCELVGEPLLLVGVDRAVLGDVGIHSEIGR